jgi:hypothetical protein
MQIEIYKIARPAIKKAIENGEEPEEIMKLIDLLVKETAHESRKHQLKRLETIIKEVRPRNPNLINEILEEGNLYYLNTLLPFEELEI